MLNVHPGKPAQRAYSFCKGLFLSACLLTAFATVSAPGVQAADAQVLTNTQWRLVEIQSMDDTQSPKRPVDRTKYTLTLAANGAVNMKLDCNQYMGKWSAKASADALSGNFAFGPLAATRMHCPAPSFEPLLSSQAESISGYQLKAGRLYLSLKADGGIWVWEPLGQLSNTPNPAIEAAIRKENPTYTKAMAGDLHARYIYNPVDLNGDGRSETLVYLMGSLFCGTGGCSMLVLDHQQKVVGHFSLVSPPVNVSESSSKGWKNLSWTQTGGGAPALTVSYRFDGKKYMPFKSGAKVTPGTSYLLGLRDFSQGAELVPLK